MKKPGVRERIMDTASRLFYSQGYNQTGINQILKEAQVAKASLYQHFRSKEDIALAYLQRRHEDGHQKITEYTAGQAKFQAKILTYFDGLLDYQKEVSFRGCGLQNIIADLPEGQTKIKEQTRAYKDERRQWIQDMIKSGGEHGDTEAEELGNQIMVLLEGGIFMSQVQQNGWPLLAAKEACRKLLEI